MQAYGQEAALRTIATLPRMSHHHEAAKEAGTPE